MDKKKHSKSKSKTKTISMENGEKFNKIKSKIKQTFSQKSIRSLSIPRSSSTYHDKSLSSRETKRRSRHKSNNTSPTFSNDSNQIQFNRMTQLHVSDSSHELIELQSIRNFHSDNHQFVNRVTDNKLTFCDVCNRELIPMGSVNSCRDCQIVCHDECVKNANIHCQSHRLSVVSNIDMDLLRIGGNENQNNQQFNNGDVKLRKKITSSESSPNDSEYHTCRSSFPDGCGNRGSFNFYKGGIEPTNCRDSLLSVTSISSIASMASQVSYDFTTLDQDSIKMYGIEVKPINQRATALIENSLTDISSIDSTSELSSVNSDSNSDEYICKPSYVYIEKDQEVTKMEWTHEELMKMSKLFNKNNFGLLSEMKSRNGERILLGTVRVYINLLRPIQMEFTSRPSSIFDVINCKDMDETNVQVETFWLPRGTSKRLYVNHSTTATEVINGLLKKFHIKANPKKFGLYEHTIEGERKVAVRKLMDIECPLGTLLSMVDEESDKINEILVVKRLVLQENETGGIEWTAFSEPELKNFLLILDREQEEHMNKIKLKYNILKNEIRRLEELNKNMICV